VMKVKVGDKVYDGSEEPVMVILNDDDKANIHAMEEYSKYCAYPKTMSSEDAMSWMREGVED